MTTIHDVAQAAGVSISTVSYALTGKRTVAPATRRRVERIAAELKYQPNARARAFARGRTSILAVTEPLRPDTYTWAHMAFVLATAQAARQYDYDILLLTQQEAADGLRRVTDQGSVDGIVILDVRNQDERVDLARSLQVPCVLIGVPAETAGLVCVDLDFAAAGRMAVQRLARAGHDHIAFIGQPAAQYAPGGPNFPPRLRAGILDQADQSDMTVATFTPETTTAVHAAIFDVMTQSPAPTAVVLHAPEQAHTATLEELARLGRAVPDDVSVVSVGQTFDTGRCSPAIDAIPLIPERSCDRAVELAMQMIEDTIEPRLELISPTYVEQGSVRPPGQAPAAGVSETEGSR